MGAQPWLRRIGVHSGSHPAKDDSIVDPRQQPAAERSFRKVFRACDREHHQPVHNKQAVQNGTSVTRAAQTPYKEWSEA